MGVASHLKVEPRKCFYSTVRSWCSQKEVEMSQGAKKKGEKMDSLYFQAGASTPVLHSPHLCSDSRVLSLYVCYAGIKGDQGIMKWLRGNQGPGDWPTDTPDPGGVSSSRGAGWRWRWAGLWGPAPSSWSLMLSPAPIHSSSLVLLIHPRPYPYYS